MSFDEIIAQFITTLQEEKTGRTYETYGKKLYVFQEFVQTQFDTSDNSFMSVLQTMEAPTFLDSVDYYVKTCNIKYKSTADSFFVVIGVFFKYLRDEFNKDNCCFKNTKATENLRTAYEDHVTNTLRLNAKEQVLPISNAQFDDLIALCNQKIDSPTFDKIISGRFTGVYTSYISALVAKFVLIFGCKNQVVDQLLISDYNADLNRIRINKYYVHLPDRLAIQIKNYVDTVRQHIVAQTPSEYLFIDISTGASLDNSKKFDILKPILANNQGTALAKYAIIQMMKGSVPAHLIMEFTGCSTTIYDHCQELFDQECGIFKIKEKSRLIDRALRGTDTFDKL